MKPILEARHVSKAYVQGASTLKILDGLDFALYPNETVSIVGKSGSGKSTLLALLAGLDSPTTGTIFYGDQNLAQLSQNQLSRLRAQHLGIVFQQYFLIPSLTALENVALPLEIAGGNDATERAIELLKLVGMQTRGHHFPHQLSGGECQRVAIARAMVGTPSLILADEPTGSLDQDTGQQITQLLFDLSRDQKVTLVMVTHNSELAERCQRRLSLKEGKLHGDLKPSGDSAR